MYKVLFTITTCCTLLTGISDCHAQNTLSAGAALLFEKGEINYYTNLRLTSGEKEQIYKQLHLHLSADKTELFDQDDKDKEYMLSTTVRVIDLNNDGKPEVFVQLYNLNWTGQGGWETAYGKNASGSFTQIMKIQGSADILLTSFKGYPDLIVGGPGMTTPTIRWNGTKYQFYKQVAFGKSTAPKFISFEKFYKQQKHK